VFTCATVARYEGEWVGGYRDGHGQMIYSDQTIYRGQWKRGYKHGFGLEVDAMGTVGTLNLALAREFRFTP
jgi:MORN repeat